MNAPMTPLFPSRWEEVLFWVAVIFGFVVPFTYFVRWTLKNAATTKVKPRRELGGDNCYTVSPRAGASC